MRILFMGTPEFAVPSLEILNKYHEIIGVFTKIDKPNQRGKKIKFNPVKQYAIDNNLDIYQVKSVKSKEVIEKIKELNPDLIVVVAYGKILPNELIEIPKYGTINVHSSLLPKYRGAAPIHYAIINGEKETGVTIMDIAEELDAGDIILQAKTEISDDDNLKSVHDRLAEIGAKTLLKAIKLIEEGKVIRKSQNHEEATFVKPILKEETKINWNKSKREIFNFVRGLDPFPGAFFTFNNKIFKLYRVEEYDKTYEDAEIGEIVEFDKKRGPIVKVKDGSIILTKVKPENKKTISGRDIINGNYFELCNRLN
ncbi:methionyl-tRNA formyltransferase [Hypnocyclicus thermotrophus]|uniref:Methionyl-tRNA formyltransferase n=1 Tax=Hypnocyclicus thermotrophus TaxID=1627895 RepID=A0AA46I554_9FUSO|nr:methionyl-tRNA formyltransferase [Hypnocyclicus thermotrophus]TDT68618.1 methionyl-tRNA formyltransferase [Hypnocyclicus thermotrophus]